MIIDEMSEKESISASKVSLISINQTDPFKTLTKYPLKTTDY